MWAGSSTSDDFPSLGHTALDEEHEQITRLFSELEAAIARGAKVAELRFQLHELEVYIRINCRSEEEMMEQDKYPILESHRMSHAALYRKLHDFEAVLLAGGLTDTKRELQQFRHAFLEHIRNEDARVARWHRLQSISPDSPD